MIIPKLLNVLIDWKRECKIDTLGLKSKYNDGNPILQIYTDRPGPMIGKAGCMIDKYKKLVAEVSEYKDIEIYELTMFLNLNENIDEGRYWDNHFGWEY